MLYPAETNDLRTSPRGPRTAMQARDRVRALLESSAIVRVGTAAGEAVLTDALLVASELVTNAVRHGGGLLGFDAALCAGGAGLRIAVTDATSTAPPSPPARPAGAVTGQGGFGWPLIHRLARSVTIVPAAHGGKRIEVVVPLGGAAGPQADPRPV
ncbi:MULTISPECIES: ATP-binding protein [unclassified Streptomyces]|uniref:ATP-binding protein n=1 Tax=unclassified Streptomyces TaxID=2593676 RepID=UPI000A43AB89|nr:MULTISPECIES: ATP-binding protein [unclassified Streptomyces]